jgi:hypothetical protein
VTTSTSSARRHYVDGMVVPEDREDAGAGRSVALRAVLLPTCLAGSRVAVTLVGFS